MGKSVSLKKKILVLQKPAEHLQTIVRLSHCTASELKPVRGSQWPPGWGLSPAGLCSSVFHDYNETPEAGHLIKKRAPASGGSRPCTSLDSALVRTSWWTASWQEGVLQVEVTLQDRCQEDQGPRVLCPLQGSTPRTCDLPPVLTF